MNDGCADSEQLNPNSRAKFRRHRWWPFMAVTGVLIVVGVAIFSDFVFGPKVLLYNDLIGADSVNETYPILVHISDYLRRHGVPSWSFSVGLGQSIFYLVGDLILQPAVWLPRQLIPSSLVYFHLAKALIAGLLFWRFLRFRRISFVASIAGALGLAFSAYMCMGGCWPLAADDTLCFTFVLFASELAITSGRWGLLPIAVALSGMATVFHLYLSAILLCFYVPARLIERYGWAPRIVLNVSSRLGLSALLGAGIGAIAFFGSGYLLLNTLRASAVLGTFAGSPLPHLLQTGNWHYYLTIILRQFSADFLGTGDVAYRGWENYYEDPLSYCTLISLLLVTQAFVGATRRERLLYAAFLFFIAVPMIFPWFRYLFWLFRGGYFRTFSLFTVFVLLVLGTTALSRYSRRGTLSFSVLALTVVIILMLLYLPIPQIQSLMNGRLRWPITLLLLVYVLLLVGGRVIRRQKLATWVIIGLTALELVWFDRTTVNRPTLLKTQLDQRVGYNDLTRDVLRDIKSNDAGFFRVTKTWTSSPANCPSYNDAMVFGYYSTSSYSSFNNANYLNFLLSVGVIEPQNIGNDSIWTPGLTWYPLLLAFACEKYAITTQPELFEAAKQYTLIKQYENIFLYRNEAFLPFGLVFGDYLPIDTFKALPNSSKPEALLRTVVLDERDAAKSEELSRVGRDELAAQIRDLPVDDVFVRRRSAALEIKSFDETQIRGKIDLESGGVLVLQMPFDRGWHAFANGEPAPVIKVDAGLTGVILKRGQHDLELKYRPPFLVSGSIVSLISLLAFAAAVWKCPRIKYS